MDYEKSSSSASEIDDKVSASIMDSKVSASEMGVNVSAGLHRIFPILMHGFIAGEEIETILIHADPFAFRAICQTLMKTTRHT